jgi:putative Mg2+ transporter-C (MgtC) family protein
MQPMPLVPGWQDFAIRFAVALVAWHRDRPESRRIVQGCRFAHDPAGLPCRAYRNGSGERIAAADRQSGSFVRSARFNAPALRILTGVGFTGAGANLRKDGLIMGVTTAATLWFVTVIGLCAGGGRIALAGGPIPRSA